MTLVDTSVRVQHLRVGDTTIADLLISVALLVHPFVVGELALGDLRQRQSILAFLGDLPGADVTTDQDVLHFIESGMAWQDSGSAMSTFTCWRLRN